MVVLTNHPISRPKPASASRSWSVPARRRPAMIEPSPGVANWLMRTQLRAVVRLTCLAAEDVFIGVHHSRLANRYGHQNAYTARNETGNRHQSHDQQESEDDKPMFGNHFAAEFQGFPEFHPPVNHKGNGKNP